jgi:hypothetical protein
MKCGLSFAGAELPTLPCPVLLSRDPLRLARFYIHALEFELVQHIVGVFASLRSAALPLQVWGRQDARPGRTNVILEQDDPSIFDVHRQLLRVAPALLDSRSPRRMPWGAWQFGLTDIDGNQLQFVQWRRGAHAPADDTIRVIPAPPQSSPGN